MPSIANALDIFMICGLSMMALGALVKKSYYGYSRAYRGLLG